MIELKQVSKIYKKHAREVRALSEVSLRVAEGKIFGIIGASGAGKSTLIRCVNLLETPTSGEIIIDGENLTTLSHSELIRARRQIGMIFQHFNLLSSRTVAENIAFPLELNGSSTKYVKQRVNELLELVGLQDKKNVYPAALSGGQKQRVAIARTLAPSPKVLLCDEATSALDPGTTNAILALLKDINRRYNITILMITHEMNVVKTICDEVAVISDGKLIEQGPVGEVFSNPKSSITVDFLSYSHQFSVPFEIAQNLSQSFNGSNYPLVKLRFTGQSNTGAVLSEGSRLFGTNTEIISANMDYARGIKFGTMLVLITGEHEHTLSTIDYYKSKAIETEVLGYV